MSTPKFALRVDGKITREEAEALYAAYGALGMRQVSHGFSEAEGRTIVILEGGNLESVFMTSNRILSRPCYSATRLAGEEPKKPNQHGTPTYVFGTAQGVEK